jgi:hypothetical protein
MSYRHISNLYQNKSVLMFKRCFAMEKLDGTSAHIAYNAANIGNELSFFGGCVKLPTFEALFDKEKLLATFKELGKEHVVVFGEAYGGSVQKGVRSFRYGPNIKFCAFEVHYNNEQWLKVPHAELICHKLGLEFVYYKEIECTLEAIDAERDAPSEQSKRNGMEGIFPREGVVLRPLEEFTLWNGGRIMCKHKRDEERETKSPRDAASLAKQAILEKANEIAEEWVTETRLEHVLDKLKAGGMEPDLCHIPKIIDAMVEDVIREAEGEIVDSKDARKAIGHKTAVMFKVGLKRALLSGT